MKKEKLPIYKYLDLSTGHITNETANWLDTNPEGVIVYSKGGYGWFIHVSEEFDDEVPKELVTVLEYARKKKCNWLVLDADGELIDELEHFDW